MTTENTTEDASRLYQAVFAHIQHGLWNDVRNSHAGLDSDGPAALPPAWLPSIHSPATFIQNTERRVCQWLDSPATDLTSIYGPFVTCALRDWGDQTLILALDTRVLFQKFCLIPVSLLFRRRAVVSFRHSFCRSWRDWKARYPLLNFPPLDHDNGPTDTPVEP